jgi:ABC-2 type transport system permease protein
MVLSIVKRELHSYFNSIIIYVVLAVFLIISGYFFYTNLIMCVLFAGSGVSIDLWEYMFNDISYMLLLLLPLVTMRLFAEEKKLGTIELLFTCPLRDADILFGKYLASLLVLTLMLLLTGLYPLLFARIHILDVPTILAGYAGLFLLGACFLACGILISSFTENQIFAAIATTGLLIAFWFIDRTEGSAGEYAFRILRDISLFRNFFYFTVGVIDTRNLLYFITVSCSCLLLTLISLRSRIWKGSFTHTGVKILGRAEGIFILIIAALISFNVLGTVYHKQFDFTPDKRFTLSDRAREILASVRGPVKITAFGKKEQRRAIEYLLERLRDNCPHISHAFIDADKNPAQIEGLKESGEKACIVEYQGHREYVVSFSEEELLKTIHFLTQGQKKIVLFTAGHGEKDIANPEKAGFSDVAAALRSDNYTVAQAVFDGTREVSAATRMIIIAGPQHDFSPEALSAIGRYFEQGGRVLLLVDPVPLPHLKAFLERYNVEIGHDIVIDTDNLLPEMDELTPVIYISREHPISGHLRAAVVFPHACSVQVGTHPAAGFSWEILGQSGRGSWAEHDLESAYNKTAQYQEGTDLRGPVQVGVIVRKFLNNNDMTHEGCMVVLGNSRFAANEYVNILGNKDFILSIADWFAEEKAVVSARPVPRGYQPAPLHSLTEAEGRLVFWSCVVIQPFLIICAGFWVIFWRRYVC